MSEEKKKAGFGPLFGRNKKQEEQKLSQLLRSYLSNLPTFRLRKRSFTMRRAFN